MMNERKMLDRLRDECDRLGSQEKWARLNGLTPSYLSDVLNGRTPAGPKVLAGLGLRRVVGYEAEKQGANT
jgi:hypothetical protein